MKKLLVHTSNHYFLGLFLIVLPTQIFGKSTVFTRVIESYETHYGSLDLLKLALQETLYLSVDQKTELSKMLVGQNKQNMQAIDQLVYTMQNFIVPESCSDKVFLEQLFMRAAAGDETLFPYKSTRVFSLELCKKISEAYDVHAIICALGLQTISQTSKNNNLLELLKNTFFICVAGRKPRMVFNEYKDPVGLAKKLIDLDCFSFKQEEMILSYLKSADITKIDSEEKLKNFQLLFEELSKLNSAHTISDTLNYFLQMALKGNTSFFGEAKRSLESGFEKMQIPEDYGDGQTTQIELNLNEYFGDPLNNKVVRKITVISELIKTLNLGHFEQE